MKSAGMVFWLACALACDGGELRGVVVAGETGEPVVGAEVNWVPRGPGRWRTTDTDASGHFAFDGIDDIDAPGELRVRSSSFGRASLPVSSVRTSAELQVLLPGVGAETLTGIGVSFVRANGNLVVSDVAPCGTGLEAGISAGSELIAINGDSSFERYPGPAGRLVRGPPGTSVTLVIRRADGGPVEEVRVVRRALAFPCR